MTGSVDAAAAAFVERLVNATNAHDLDGLVACFADEYRNETPAHPGRGFVGRERVRKNWEQIFASVPDVTTDVLRTAVDGATVWTEWEHRGTRPDGTPHVMRGVILFGLADGVAEWARFYLEPVRDDGQGVDAFIRSHMAGGTP